MRVVGLVGSPRRGRNTATLVQKVLDGAKSQGAEVKLLYLTGISPCLACDLCKEKRSCVQDDAMQPIYALLDEAQGIVIGSPIYFDHISAQTKTFFDRLYKYIGPNMEHRFHPGVRAVIVLTWEALNPQAYEGVADWLQERLRYYLGIETVERLLAAQTGRHPVGEREDLLQRAFQAGVKLVQACREVPTAN